MITVVFYFFAGIPVLLAALLLFGAKVEFFIRLEACYVRLKLRIKLLYGVFHIELDCVLPPNLELTVNGRQLKKREKKKKSRERFLISPMEFSRIIIKGLVPKKLFIWGIVGVNNNAALSAAVSGLVRIAADIASTGFNVSEKQLNIMTRTDGGAFSLNLAGIVQIKTVQIIRAALKRYIIKKREKKTSYDTSC